MFRITNGDGKHAGRRMENVRSCLGYHVFRVMRLKGCMMCVPNDISHVVSFCCDAAAVCSCSVRMNVCLYTGHTSYMNSIPNMKMNCAKIAKYHIDPLLSRWCWLVAMMSFMVMLLSRTQKAVGVTWQICIYNKRSKNINIHHKQGMSCCNVWRQCGQWVIKYFDRVLAGWGWSV